MNDTLGDRMKKNYEDRTRMFLPRRTNMIIRLDGRAFHTYTKEFALIRPFDLDFIEDMNRTAVAVCEEVSGAKIVYVQSDEISILVTDYDTIETNAWFDGNIQKIVSVAASIATAKFNQLRYLRSLKGYLDTEEMLADLSLQPVAHFDARVFIIPDIAEVANYFLWRNQDCSRNSIQMVARAMFSHKECDSKKTPELMEMIKTKSGSSFEDIAPALKYGRTFWRSGVGEHLKFTYEAIYYVDFESWANRIKLAIS